ncbi:hypothetical protein DEI97_003275 [Curtobacterium sp. MCLR17_032]|uniref:hypothetical protein n=1 Tax=Curtobacterium sp. MCLR17_032 TaxID=2175650 RepID=UPI000DA9CAC2|nr:hypothetical protein [Curtobacterium sp. MCLR17_032]WIE62180.1 hypothetical protein DEI97_003275 [Curtobacterium sp. MCLR17_032]
MSSTPLFDAIARRSAQSGAAPSSPIATPARNAAPTTIAPSASTAPAVRLDAPAGLSVPSADLAAVHGPATSVPSSPLAVVPADLVEMIDGIPASLRASLAREHVVCQEQLPLVEAVVDAVTRAVVDAVAIEVERIVASGVVRG